MEPVRIAAPPDLPKPVPGHPVARLLPVVMLVACVGMMAVYFTSGAASLRNPMFMFFPVMMAMSVLGSVFYGARGGVGRSAEIDQNRRKYLRYLAALDRSLADDVDRHWRSEHSRHPDPTSLWSLAQSRGRWERGPADPDFCRIRIGVGSLASSPSLIAPDIGSSEEVDPVTTSALHAFVARRSLVHGLPISLPLRDHTVVAVEGDREQCRALVRAMVCQLATWHAPSVLRIDAAVSVSLRDEWEWLKWLPHKRRTDGHDPVHTVVVHDGDTAADAAPGSHLTVIDIGGAPVDSVSGVRVHLRGDEVTVSGPVEMRGRPDEMTRIQAVVCARRLARCRLADSEPHERVVRGWLDLIGVDDISGLAPESLWANVGPQRLTPVPIGVSEDGSPVTIDVNEAAHGGMGPHGLCVGATGSGKSEFLRTLVLGLLATHPPDVLNLVLVDFKGGATFLGMERARHVAAVITNLADEAHLVARMNDALAGELHRRQELLRAAGGFANISEYERARARDEALPPLPALMIIVDEFSELLSQHPDFAELFVAIGRLGRSLGIHLLLASQRLDEGRLRGLDTHLSYRVCLKTFSAGESRSVLGVPDAHQLPNTPGAAFLKTAAGDLIRFQTSFVSGSGTSRRADAPEAARPMIFSADAAGDPQRQGSGDLGPSVLEAVLNSLADRGVAAHRLWLPPLPTSPTLDMVTSVGTGLGVPIGLVDSPFAQRHDLLTVQLDGARGNVAVVGAPGAGKSTCLRTLLLALAEAYSPAEVGFHCLDFGGGALAGLRELPHVGSVASRAEADLCRRTVAVVEQVIRKRESRFRRLSIDSMAGYRARRAAGDPAVADDPYGDVFLVVDGWAVVRQQFEALEAAITAIAAQGLSFGVHVMLAASRWAELRPAIKDPIGTRLELRLGDPAESEMDRRRARLLAAAPPGRGLTADGREFAVALPRWDGERSASGLPEAIAATVVRLQERWPQQSVPRVELLPAVVPHRRLVPDARSPMRIPIGIGEDELRPAAVDFTEQPHLLVLGESGCGKSSLLRLLCRQIVRTADADRVQLEIVDFRRALLGVVESEHLSGYAASPAALTPRLEKLLARLEARMPGEETTQSQLRDRSWWSGPDIFLIVDDYDMVGAATGNPLTPLADFLPHATDLGFHVVIARRSGGAARAMFDPVLARMREVGCTGLMMSASPDDGVLLGTVRPSSQPPGRGTLVTRSGGEQLIQVGWADPP